MTAWWAGPIASHLLATFGAEVIHVESPRRPDGMRMIGGMMAAHYERLVGGEPALLYANSNKLAITLDLSQAARVSSCSNSSSPKCDAIVENFTPACARQLRTDLGTGEGAQSQGADDAHAGFRPDRPMARQHRIRADHGTDCRGLAWVTGHRQRPADGIPRGPCDPRGRHAWRRFAFLVTLAGQSRARARGHHIESTMVESALNIAAEYRSSSGALTAT